MTREKCPCCGYPTLSARGEYEICLLCDWEDDNQGDADAADVRGGPNGDYSLQEARGNFMKNFLMYRGNNLVVHAKAIKVKKSLMAAYNEELWASIVLLKNELMNETYKKKSVKNLRCFRGSVSYVHKIC